MNNLSLNFSFKFSDLYNTKSLIKLDKLFLESLPKDLLLEIIETRNSFTKWELDHSKLSINIAPYLEDFIAKLFCIEIDKSNYPPLAKIFECKKIFVRRYALKTKKESYELGTAFEELSDIISKNLNKYDISQFEQIFAEYVLTWVKENDQDKIDIAADYAIWACLHKDGIKKHQSGTLFRFPHKLDFEHLVDLEELEENGISAYRVPKEKLYTRKGFKLTDPGCKTDFAVDQANYCIHCHNQEKDSCSKGTKDLEQKGCPLDEKISEMNFLKSRGVIIGSLAMAIVDNPMLAATGHRICNDCMKACIYQKQQPVDIPQIETRVLKDVLDLPWGFEIYSLLTRWNPLSFSSPLPKENTNAKVLVAGMGPAGFTLSHYLLNEGHIVVGIDGLKIEPLNSDLLNKPIKHVEELFEDLDKRIVSGFGGVMEYGITNRWDKNFLLLIRLLLERRENFKLFSGTRLGSNITPKQAFSLGFSHISLALGAGSPRLLELDNSLAKGVRTASDFLMSLQLGSAYRKESITNLQLRMPVVVVGGGLTALDAATESMAYYPELVKNFNKPSVILSDEEQEIADEFIAHNELFSKSDSLIDSMKSLGGVKILYRNKIQKAPSYRLNHEEVNLGLSEGIDFVENITPTEILLDKYGAVDAIKAIQNGKEVIVPAKTILIAAGTVPNIMLSKEHPEFLTQDGKYFSIKQDKFITYNNGINSMSFFGDLHPEYAGNVVKAMASAKNGYKSVSKLLKKDPQKREEFFDLLEEKLTAKLVAVNRLTSNIIELVIKSPLAAENFQPGQFFKLQNYAGNLPLIEPLALTGAKVENGCISTIVLEMGDSSNLCAKLEINKPVVLMGPTGTATEIHANENIMLVGGGLGNAVLFSIGQALRAQNSNVLYFAGYRKLADRYKIEEIEQAADKIIWSCDEELLETTRDTDTSFKGNIIESIIDFAKNNPEALQKIDRIIVIGSDKMMHAMKQARHNILKPYLNQKHIAIGSINSPMQCMMKEICGQCLQKHIDPDTGDISYVFSCTNQDQELDRVDFHHLDSRLSQNKLLEKQKL
jgi:NADPH-dependent glutamate synthase beta subunit-like oxidoreductase/NAD(P)H-flavin reductase